MDSKATKPTRAQLLRALKELAEAVQDDVWDRGYEEQVEPLDRARELLKQEGPQYGRY